MNLAQPRTSCTYKIAGAKTFRLSSSMIFERWGTNMQNWEKGLRKIIKADPGYKLVNRDQAGAEAKIVAYLCRNGNYRKLFENNIKPHVFVCLHTFSNQLKKKFNYPDIIDLTLETKIEELKNIPEWKSLDSLIKSSDNWQSSERYYFISKKLCHATAYGLQANRFVLSVLEETNGQVVLERKNAQEYLDNTHKLFPEIREWQFKVQKLVRETKTLRNLFGFPYKITDFIGDDFNEFYAFIPQSTVGTLTNVACTEFQDKIEQDKLNYHLLGNCHDSLLAQCPDSSADIKNCSQIMKDCIEKTFISPEDGTKFNMTSECHVGYNWSTYNEEYNPKGLINYEDN